MKYTCIYSIGRGTIRVFKIMNVFLKATFTSLSVRTAERRICNFQKNHDNPYFGGDPFKGQQLYNVTDIPTF